MELADKRR
jgi:hypothetical protein